METTIFSFLSPKYIKSFRRNNIPIALFKILIYILGVLKIRGWNALSF
jgi:hypothetical protein